MLRFILFFFFSILIVLFPSKEVNATSLSTKLQGKFLIQVEDYGKAWYVNPVDGKKYFLGTPIKALETIKKLSLTTSITQLDKFEDDFPEFFSGLFLHISTSSNYYLNPKKLSVTKISSPYEIYNLIKLNGIGITNLNINKIPTANSVEQSININDFEKPNQWWGEINSNYIPVMEKAATSSKRLGTFWKINRVKILDVAIGDEISSSTMWYKIDGGMYPGAYVHSSFVTKMIQPYPEQNIKIPENVKENEKWIDVNLSKKIITLFKYNKPIFSTYIATGLPSFPTRTGTYKIQSKHEKIRMDGGPPQFPEVYDLKDVPWTMYYSGSYAIHGTYWHDKFGSARSHGCTNLTRGDAEYIFKNVNPKTDFVIASLYANKENPGTVVYNHY